MEKRNTKEIILMQALTLFSQRGYEGVSMRDIANEVGIKVSSLYSHYQNKEDIFKSILEEMSLRYNEEIKIEHIPNGDLNQRVVMYMNITEESLLNIATHLFLYYLKDDYASKFRRVLIMEQFRTAYVGETFEDFFINGVLNYQSQLFEEMIKKGGFRDGNAYVMALHFYSSIFLLLCKYDRHLDKEEEAVKILKEHVKQFTKIYLPVSKK